jgi:hypothetical protein
MTCIFCRKQGHCQEDCRKRIISNQPCLDSNGKPFWPKFNMTDTGAPILALLEPGFQFWDWWDPYFKLLLSFLSLLWVCVLFQLWLNFLKSWCLFMGETRQDQELTWELVIWHRCCYNMHECRKL